MVHAEDAAVSDFDGFDGAELAGAVECEAGAVVDGDGNDAGFAGYSVVRSPCRSRSARRFRTIGLTGRAPRRRG